MLVFTFQRHVEYIALVAHVAPHESAFLSLLIVGLDLVDGEGGQVLQCFLHVAFEEVAAVDEQ